MKLFEMQIVPVVAGSARIQFNDTANPSREGATIVLPQNPELEFYPLKRGEQFLVRHHKQLWFGGTDEQPFLVSLEPNTFSRFMEGGEQDFFAALVPEEVTEMEKDLKTSTRRQGDIFAVKLPISWDEIAEAMEVIYGHEKWKPECVKRRSVFKTRHRLTGKFSAFTHLLGWENVVVVEGILVAPDHSPMTLVGLHALYQARHLRDPKNAD